MDDLSDNTRAGAMGKCLLVSSVFGNANRLCSGGAARGRNGHRSREGVRERR